MPDEKWSTTEAIVAIQAIRAGQFFVRNTKTKKFSNNYYFNVFLSYVFFFFCFPLDWTCLAIILDSSKTINEKGRINGNLCIEPLQPHLIVPEKNKNIYILSYLLSIFLEALFNNKHFKSFPYFFLRCKLSPILRQQEKWKKHIIRKLWPKFCKTQTKIKFWTMSFLLARLGLFISTLSNSWQPSEGYILLNWWSKNKKKPNRKAKNNYIFGYLIYHFLIKCCSPYIGIFM